LGASLYQAQGRHQLAEPLYKRSLAIREKAPLKENPDIVSTLHGLAYLYQTQGRHQLAEALYKRSLAILEKLQWKKHPLAAQSLQGLAQVYQVQGDIKGATDFLRRQLAIEEHNLALYTEVELPLDKFNQQPKFLKLENP
jgi:tetratricopeptide (TPR) repeat protein